MLELLTLMANENSRNYLPQEILEAFYATIEELAAEYGSGKSLYFDVARTREYVCRDFVDRGWIADAEGFRRFFDKQFESKARDYLRGGRHHATSRGVDPDGVATASGQQVDKLQDNESQAQKAGYAELNEALAVVAYIRQLVDVKSVTDFLRQGKRIDALKEFRQQTYLGLKEAMQTIDCLANAPLGDQVLRLMHRGTKAAAVKVLLKSDHWQLNDD